MSMTLNLVDRLLAAGRNLHKLGREQDALHIFSRLSGFRQLPAEVAEETQVRLAEISLHRERYKRARRHLTAVLRYQPDNPRYHCMMAHALEDDERCDPEHAALHYRRSLQIDPNNTDCLCDYGRLALRLGHAKEGLKCLRKAVELSPNDPHAVECLAQELTQTGQMEEARTALRCPLPQSTRPSVPQALERSSVSGVTQSARGSTVSFGGK